MIRRSSDRITVANRVPKAIYLFFNGLRVQPDPASRFLLQRKSFCSRFEHQNDLRSGGQRKSCAGFAM